MIEPSGAGSQPAAPAPAPGSRLPRSGAVIALVLISALVSGTVAAAVTLAVLRSQARTNPQTVDLGSHVTITEENVAVQVAAKAVPAVVSVMTQESGQTATFGSGFLLTSDGYIATNGHVVANARTLTILFDRDSRKRDARVVDYDCQTGLAILKVDGVSGAPTLPFSDPGSVKLGQTVVAVAGPLATRNTAKGIVSGLHRNLSVGDPVDTARERVFSNTIQTDVAIDSATSGGPLLNVGGQVVGINLAATWRNQPVTLALASDEVRPDLDQVLQGGQLTVASLGVDYLDLDSSEAALRSLPVGGLVRSVQPGGPAEQAGIKAGDVVTQLDDVKLDQARPLGQVLRTNYKPSQRVAVTLFRGGASTQVQATLVGQHPRCT